MRAAGLALALLASTQLTLMSSPAFAQDEAPPPPPSTAAAPSPAPSGGQNNSGKKTTGWIILGVGGAVGIGGIIVDVVAGNMNKLSGAGGPGDNGQTNSATTNLVFLGTTMILGGVIGMIYGGSMVYSADHADSKSSPRSPDLDDASRDDATKAVQAKLSSSPTFTIPVLGATF
jgi:hypothetical protein